MNTLLALLLAAGAAHAATDPAWTVCNERAGERQGETRQTFMVFCISGERAKATRAEEAKQARKPGAALGMTQHQVVADTAWGKPRSVNRTVTASGVHEQWVYPGGYLYFDNGRLTAIQN